MEVIKVSQHNQTIKCTHCGCEVDVTDAMYKILEERYKEEHAQKMRDFENQLNQKREQYKKAMDVLQSQQLQLERDRAALDADVQRSVNEKLSQERVKLSNELKIQIQKEHLLKEELLEKELEEKSKELIEKSRLEADLIKLKREKEEVESKANVKYEQMLSQKIQEEQERLQKQIEEGYILKMKEQEVRMNQLKEQLKITQQKVEQGSQQMQGEVQELAIEEYLQGKYPLDEVGEVKKGAHGADTLQVVHTRDTLNCGKIYYESKRTKDFQPSWIEKLKADMRDIGADIGVIVTATLPKDIERMGIKNGVWICSFEDFKILSNILRDNIINLHFVRSANQNRDDKMNSLYNYLTSSEFSMCVEAIVESFTKMQSDLESEKRSLSRIWKAREKELEKVIQSTTNMYGAITGIAGAAIGHVKALELPYVEEIEA